MNPSTPLLAVRDLSVGSKEKTILHNITLTIAQGELHVLLGSNGAGKSTLLHALVGKPGYTTLGGHVTFAGKKLLDQAPEERAHAGLFMAFQQPIAVPGVSNMHFLQTAINAHRQAKGLEPAKSIACLHTIKSAMKQTAWDTSFLGRNVHEDLSGGEKKRSELLQLALLAPKLAMLDEIDSGLDSKGRALAIRLIRAQQQKGCAFLIITHYHDFAKELAPTKVHQLEKGIMTSVDASATHL